MMAHDLRFQRLGEGAAGGVKIATRRQANAGLSSAQAADANAFLALLQVRLGAPDKRGDVMFSYSVRDVLTGVEFEAYAGASGPAYGGVPADHFVDFEGGDNRTKQDVLDVLAVFEQWLVS
jgi:hypothetical protein